MKVIVGNELFLYTCQHGLKYRAAVQKMGELMELGVLFG